MVCKRKRVAQGLEGEQRKTENSRVAGTVYSSKIKDACGDCGGREVYYEDRNWRGGHMNTRE